MCEARAREVHKAIRERYSIPGFEFPLLKLQREVPRLKSFQ